MYIGGFRLNASGLGLFGLVNSNCMIGLKPCSGCHLMIEKVGLWVLCSKTLGPTFLYIAWARVCFHSAGQKIALKC
jgi:hypothetical protein